MQLNSSNTDNNTRIKMTENEATEKSKRKLIRQPPSVPFLWEDMPGIPKKGWKPEKRFVYPTSAVPSTPAKLFASIPFKWEEIPGKPLPTFLEPLTDDTFISDPSLLANRLQSSVAFSDAVPVKKIPIHDVGSPLKSLSSSSSESGSSTSSYETGTASHVGASFLDNLFPLVAPTSGFLDNAGNPENGTLGPLEKKSNDLECVSNCNAVVRRSPTLGELIMMSRRRSCRRKAVQMRRNNLSMNFTKKAAFGCWIFGISRNKVRRLQGMIRQPRLTLT